MELVRAVLYPSWKHAPFVVAILAVLFFVLKQNLDGGFFQSLFSVATWVSIFLVCIWMFWLSAWDISGDYYRDFKQLFSKKETEQK